MSAESTQVSIHIAGNTYEVKCPNDAIQELQAAAQYLDQKIRDVSQRSQHDLEKNIVMAALQLSHELLIEKKLNGDSIKKMGHRIEQLIKQFNRSSTRQEEIDF
ncbi:MAG: cell division protein ZapA [Legionellales bacterium]|nr:cell division protein ZapA [Legionellales bacterium]